MRYVKSNFPLFWGPSALKDKKVRMMDAASFSKIWVTVSRDHKKFLRDIRVIDNLSKIVLMKMSF